MFSTKALLASPYAGVQPSPRAACCESFTGRRLGLAGFGWVRDFAAPHWEARTFDAKWVRFAFSLVNPVKPANSRRPYRAPRPPVSAGNPRGIIQFSHHPVPEVKSTWH